MNISYLLYFLPLIEGSFSELPLALVAKISYFSFLGITFRAEVIEENIDYEVFRKIFPFVLPNVFGAQLHLSSLNVIASLDKSGVEHDSKHCLVGKPCMFEDNLDIAPQDTAILLLFSQEEDYSPFFRRVLLRSWVRKHFLDVQSPAMIHIEERYAAITRVGRNIYKLNSS